MKNIGHDPEIRGEKKKAHKMVLVIFIVFFSTVVGLKVGHETVIRIKDKRGIE